MNPHHGQGFRVGSHADDATESHLAPIIPRADCPAGLMRVAEGGPRALHVYVYKNCMCSYRMRHELEIYPSYLHISQRKLSRS